MKPLRAIFALLLLAAPAWAQSTRYYQLPGQDGWTRVDCPGATCAGCTNCGTCEGPNCPVGTQSASVTHNTAGPSQRPTLDPIMVVSKPKPMGAILGGYERGEWRESQGGMCGAPGMCDVCGQYVANPCNHSCVGKFVTCQKCGVYDNPVTHRCGYPTWGPNWREVNAAIDAARGQR